MTDTDDAADADDDLHCYNCGGTYDEKTGDTEDDGDCVHCECCCSCLGCEYGPQNGLGMTDEQRAPAAAFAASIDTPTGGDFPRAR